MNLRCLPRSLPDFFPTPSHLLLTSSLSRPIKSLTSFSKPGSGFRCIRVNNALEERSTFVSELESRTDEGTSYAEIVSEEEGESPEKSGTEDFINSINLKFDSDETYYSILIYGTGALVALSLSAGVVSALDSIPLIPKVFEVVGFAYTIWFSYRYLIFKDKREELFTKINELKGKIIGMDDD